MELKPLSFCSDMIFSFFQNHECVFKSEHMAMLSDAW